MIINNIVGGIGNAMFQIAAGYSHSLKCNTDYAINYNFLPQPGQGLHHSNYKNNIFSKIKETKRNSFKIFNEDLSNFNYSPIPIIDDLCLQGYFQTEKYFKIHEKGIRDLFCLPKKIQNVIYNKLNKFKKKKVGVHIRWGDYKSIPDVLPPVSEEYIIKAMSLFNSNDSDFILITDDLDLVKKKINTDKFVLLNNQNEIEDLITLSMCDSVIMSNSTFSWWGSWLGKKKEKIIAPQKWFGNKGPAIYNDVYRDEMIVI
mgnify:CR=1 FL=1